VDPSRVRSTQILAIRAEPPESTPGEGRVQFTALVAVPDGTTAAPLTWTFCAQPRAPADPTETSARCLLDGPHQIPFGAQGTAVVATLPADACGTVGPEAPTIGPTGASRRAPDPDATGGYYLPVRATLDAAGLHEVAFARLRIRCARPDVSTELAREFAARSAPNHNPIIAALAPGISSASRPGHVELTITLTADSAERYVRIDAFGAQIVDDVEHLSVSWFTTAGSFTHARTSLAGGTTSSSNELSIAADAPGTALVWVVVRDGRGGVAYQELAMPVAP